MHFGLVCTSFCWINSASHGRRASLPLGNSDRDYVRLGDRFALCTVPRLNHDVSAHATCLAFTQAALALLAWSRGAGWSIEQPMNSALRHHPSFQLLLQYFQDMAVVPGLGAQGIHRDTWGLSR